MSWMGLNFLAMFFMYFVDVATSYEKCIIASLLPMKCMFRERLRIETKVTLTRNSRCETTKTLNAQQTCIAISSAPTDEIRVLWNRNVVFYIVFSIVRLTCMQFGRNASHV